MEENLSLSKKTNLKIRFAVGVPDLGQLQHRVPNRVDLEGKAEGNLRNREFKISTQLML